MSRFSSGVVSSDFVISSNLDLTTTTATETRFLLATMNFTSAIPGRLRRARGSAEQGEIHAAGIDEASAPVRSETN